MATIMIPYSRQEMCVNVPDKNLVGIFKPEEVEASSQAACSESEIVQQALDMPIESERLERLAENKKNIVVITSDHTRPVPSGITMPILLERLRKNNNDADITILAHLSPFL